MKIYGLECPICKDKIYSRARHDLRSCSCGYCFIDGGFDYNRIGNTEGGYPPPKGISINLPNITKEMLYDDWNKKKDKYGLIKFDILKDSLKNIKEKDKKRIIPIISSIMKIWNKNPNLRFCQLIQNCFGKEEIYYKSDKELVKKLGETYEV